MDKETILSKLPPYSGTWDLIAPEQTVGDIIAEVLEAHKAFASHYDKIALCFDGDNVSQVCENIYAFEKKYFLYDEQGEENQMTMSPAAMIKLKNVDCKNFAGFCGGVLDGLNRLTERKIKWVYRFASYRPLDSTPHHVFIVVNPGENEIWIDPTPGANYKKPFWQLDKKIKSMPLHRVSAIDVNDQPAGAIGIASLVVTPKQGGDDNINWDGTNKFAGIFDPYLGLSMYRDLGGDRNINDGWLAGEINKLIETGPAPGHSVDSAFVKWIYNNSVRSWNFFYPGGVRPGFTGAGLLPAGYPVPVVTEDDRLALSNNTPVDDYRNSYIHILTAWLQDQINSQSTSPYPLTPQLVKEFSQEFNGPVTGNLFDEPRGQSIFSDIGDALKKFALAGFRNAYLGLVGLNVFGLATQLKNAIYQDDGVTYDQYGYPRIKDGWEKLGGNFEKLQNTVNDGAAKKAILGTARTIGVLPAAIAAWAAAAATVIAAMRPIINDILKNKQSQTGINYFMDPATGLPYPDSGAGGFSASGVFDWIKTHPIESAGIGFLLYYFLKKKSKTQPKVTGIDNSLLLYGGLGLLAYSYFRKRSGDSSSSTAIDKRAWINQFTGNEISKAVAVMADSEISDVYAYLHDYFQAGLKDKIPAALKNRIDVISYKYDIFT